jgi:hypothetical protein
VERGFSVVRRKLLLKNRGPQDAQGLYARAVKAYSYGDYLESLHLAWAAVQLDSQDARFWFARAMSERALGDGESARASARRGAALDFLTRNDSVRMLDHVSTADQGFLREASAGLTRESARRIAAGSAPLESLARTVNSNSSSDSRELAHKVPWNRREWKRAAARPIKKPGGVSAPPGFFISRVFVFALNLPPVAGKCVSITREKSELFSWRRLQESITIQIKAVSAKSQILSFSITHQGMRMD